VLANPEHLELLRRGVDAWNAWRGKEPSVRPDLSGTDLSEADLRGATLLEADFSEANLTKATLSGANLTKAWLGQANLSEADLTGANLTKAWLGDAILVKADLFEANLTEAILSGADLREADLRGANLTKAWLSDAILHEANLSGANLHEAHLGEASLFEANLFETNFTGADLRGADLSLANLKEAKLRGADLSGANLTIADLTKADLGGANLSRATLVETNLAGAVLTGCHIYGVSAWDMKLEGTKQNDLVITRIGEPAVAVDNIEVAQFVYLLLRNEKIRDVIDTVTSKVVLILGRFTPERKAVLDAIRDELRRRAYVPILFDFNVPATRDITETVSLLARMARFIVAGLTDPSSIPKELEAIVPHLAVPVQPLLEGDRPYAMFKDYWKYDWVLPVQRYESVTSLIEKGATKFIEAAESKMDELADKRRRFEAELTRPR
jgi:uncharacterized protein YjbI with pentapeptide repeats